MRRKDSAMMKRVKLVTMMRRPGATDSTVRSATISMMRPLAEAPPEGISAPRSTVCAAAGGAARATASRERQPGASLDDQRTENELAHLSLRAGRGALVEVLADGLESDRPLELLQRDGPEIGENVFADFAGDRFGMRQGLGVEHDRASSRIQVSCGAPRLVTIGGRS